MADCMQFISENRLNGCQIFGRFGFKTESEPNFGFPQIPITNVVQTVPTWLYFDGEGILTFIGLPYSSTDITNHGCQATPNIFV